MKTICGASCCYVAFKKVAGYESYDIFFCFVAWRGVRKCIYKLPGERKY